MGNVYVTVVKPTVTPLTTPLNESIGAIAGLLLLHTPPPAASLNVDVLPVQIFIVPVIAGGLGFTVNTAVVLQVVGKV